MKKERAKALSGLKIDTTLRRADFSQIYGDIENAKIDYANVIKLCEEFTDKNERVLSSSHFSLGKLHEDSGDKESAMKHFKSAAEVLKLLLLSDMKAKGQHMEVPSDGQISVEKLIEPSIFDDDRLKDLKASLLEIHSYVRDFEEHFHKWELAKKEAQKAQEVQVTKEFGEAPKDKDQFTSIKIKSKKRTADQVQVESGEAERDSQGAKKLKTDQ